MRRIFFGPEHEAYRVVLRRYPEGLDVTPAVMGATLVADIVAPYFVGLGSAEQRARWLPGIVSGETILAIPMTEPGAAPTSLASARLRLVTVTIGSSTGRRSSSATG